MARWDIVIDLIKTNGYRNIAEIGVYRGKTARKVLSSTDSELAYFMIEPNWHLQLSILSGTDARALYMLRTSQEASRFIANGFLDLVFLDALHDYEHVMEDIRRWMPKIRKGGILCGDDYGQAHCEGVKQAIDEVFGDRVELREVGRKGVKIWVVGL